MKLNNVEKQTKNSNQKKKDNDYPVRIVYFEKWLGRTNHLRYIHEAWLQAKIERGLYAAFEKGRKYEKEKLNGN